MKIRHGLALLTAAATLVLATGCTSDDKGGSGGGGKSGSTSAKAPAADPAVNAMRASTNDLATTTYRYTVTAGGQTIAGSTDPNSGDMSFTTSRQVESLTLAFDVLLIGKERFLKVSGVPLPGLDPKKWLRIDASKAKNLDNLGIGDAKDPLSAKAFSDAIVSAEKTGDRSYRGVVDLSKATTFGPLEEDDIKVLGDKAKAVPFEATVDDKGRLLTLKMTTPALGNVKENKIDAAFSDYGAALTLTKPAAADTQETPEALYAIFNG